MKQRVVLFLAMSALLALQGVSAENEKPRFSIRVYPHVEYFEWTESLDGEEILKESGLLYGIGAAAEIALGKRLSLMPGLDLFAGEVDYDGQLQYSDGTLVPYESTTTYYGMEFNLKLGMPIDLSDKFTLKPAGGIGARTWSRQLDTAMDDDEVGEYGYTEYWFASFVTLGAELDWWIASRTHAYVQACLRVPLYTSETVDFSDSGGPDDVTLEPKANVSVQAEAGIRFRYFFAALFAETLSFDESDLDSEYEAFYQPDSEAEIYGIKAGVAF